MWTAPGTTSTFSVPSAAAHSAILPASSRPRARFAASLLDERIRPEQERTHPADRDADLFGRPANRRELLRSALGREVVFEVVVQLDAVEARILRELQALLSVICSG